MTGGVCRSFRFFVFVSATHDEQRHGPHTGIVPTAKKTKRPPNATQQKPRANPKHATGAPAVPRTCPYGRIPSCRGPEPVRHGTIPIFDRFRRKKAQSSAKCTLRSDAHH